MPLDSVSSIGTRLELCSRSAAPPSRAFLDSARYSCSLMAKYTLIGCTCETVVSTVSFLTRLPTCVAAMPAMPSSSDRTFVQPRFSCAVSTAASCACTRGLVRRLRLQIVVQLRPRDGARFRQRRIALGVDLGQLQICLRLGQLALGLVERCLEGPGIDLIQDLPLAHLRAFFVVLPDQIAGDLGLDLRVDIAIEIGHPLAIDRARLSAPPWRWSRPAADTAADRRLAQACCSRQPVPGRPAGAGRLRRAGRRSNCMVARSQPSLDAENGRGVVYC